MKILNVNRHGGLRVFFSCLLIAAISLPSSAQTVQEADAAFKEFVRLNNTNGDRATMFNTLYTCYADYVAVINRCSIGCDGYIQA
jgi:hypothetical protein